MTEKPYEWLSGAKLEEHSKRKHKIIREYFARYLAVRCQNPHVGGFRLAIVEGFAGGGRYACGTSGSPLIFVEELKHAITAAKIRRAAHGMKTIQIECLLILNDAQKEVVELLKENIAPLLAGVKETLPELHIETVFLSEPFEQAYPAITELLRQGRFRNVVFNLDQCGHSHVMRSTLSDILRSYPSVEIFYTFMIEALLTYLRKSDPAAFAMQLAHLHLSEGDLKSLEGMMSKQSWLGVAERLVFEAFCASARYVSPFSINNPDGWRYWLIHFANSYRGRQEYNNILHQNSSAQAHFGRSGLNMLAYNPADDDGRLYLFDPDGRAAAKDQLREDIPRLVAEFGDALSVGAFYESIYNETPAHMDDIHAAMIDNDELEVITRAGGERRKAKTINVDDIIRLRQQRTFFPILVPKK